MLWLLSSCGVFGGEIEGDLLFRVVFLYFIFFWCSCVQFDLIS